jgi:ABC-2 type transport system ATP-binding protein
MENSPVIRVNDVTKLYGKVTGVRDISLIVEKGDIFGFLGPNGSGKTTTIRLLLDLLRPDKGIIEVLGKELRKFSFEIRQKCGYLPGNFNAYGNLTGRQFLQFLGHFRKVNQFNQPDLQERLGISDLDLKRKIKHLSHGTLQKLGIMQAFWCYPELMILDEPTIGLDPLMQNVFYDLLKQYQQKRITVFLSSHNLSEVEKICNKVAIIRKGQIIKTESITQLRKSLNRKLFITLKHPIDQVELDAARLISRRGLSLEFELTGDPEIMLRQLANWPVAEMTMPEPDLQEIFMNYYNGKHE